MGQNLIRLSREELEAGLDKEAQSVVHSYNSYYHEIQRRDQVENTKAILKLTRIVVFLTIVATIATVVSTVAAVLTVFK